MIILPMMASFSSKSPPSARFIGTSRGVSREMATANELWLLLREEAAVKNLYDHLTETLMRVVLENEQVVS